jgi:hypothetical protein
MFDDRQCWLAFSFKPKFVPVVEAAQKGSQPLALR